mgnify:CR=1 FL=1|jgi:hypothetical protein
MEFTFESDVSAFSFESLDGEFDGVDEADMCGTGVLVASGGSEL